MTTLFDDNLIVNEQGYPFTINRDSSWLKFNHRVLKEADDTATPLMERLKFLTIYQSNLDEFFMIRIGSMFDIVDLKEDAVDSRTGSTLAMTIRKLYDEVADLTLEANRVFLRLVGDLAKKGIEILDFASLQRDDMEKVAAYFGSNIRPLLSPQVIDSHHPFPHILSKTLHVVLRLTKKDKSLLGIIPVPAILPRLLRISQNENRYIRMEEILLGFSGQIFHMYNVQEQVVIAVTRNADLNFYDEIVDDATNAKIKVKRLLERRKTQNAVRLELSSSLSKDLLKLLMERFELQKHQCIVTSSPMRFDTYRETILNDLVKGKDELLYPPYAPIIPLRLRSSQRITNYIMKHDVLLHYPYESMEPYLRLLREAADDPQVLSIKITIYRLSKNAKLIEYLSRASENGKEVLAVIELRARFDEQNNIDWSDRLEQAGCKIIYGLDTYKVHSKTTLITYNIDGALRYITQVGTGNFNERTVEQYDDLSLITANQEIGLDAVNFFLQIQLSSQEDNYRHLLVSPNLLKREVLRLIDREIAKGTQGYIAMKLNAITDMDIILALHKASMAGVVVKMVVRSICCIRPEVPGYTDQIEIHSVVGRFLEHSRIYQFGTYEDRVVYISSADMMTRNTERRVEVAVPIYDLSIQDRIVEMIQMAFKDNIKGKKIDNQGKHVEFEEQESINVQSAYMDRYHR